MRRVVLVGIGLLGMGCTPEDTDTVTDDTPWHWQDTAEEEQGLPTGPCGRGVAAMLHDRAFSTIQAALDAAWEGSRVEICPGVHTESLVVDRILTLQSWSRDPSDTILDGQGEHRILYAETGVGVGRLTLRGGVADQGGAIYGRSFVSVCDSVIVDCAAQEDGGAVYARGGVDCSDSLVQGNQAGGRGGAFYARRDSDPRHCTFVGNTAAEGGAIYAGGEVNPAGGEWVWMSDSRFESNRASLRGGAVVVRGEVSFVMEDCTFVGNSSEGDAGALSIEAESASIYSSEFLGNISGQDVGALSIEAETADVHSSDFVANTSQGDAGALAISAVEILVQGCEFEDSLAAGSAGALLLMGEPMATLRTCDFTGNVATLQGGALSSAGGSLEVRSSTFEGNRADQGGALYVEQSELTVPQSSLVFNTASSRGAALYLSEEEPLSQIRLWTSEIGDNTAEEGALYLAGPVDLLVDESSVLRNTDAHGAVVLDSTPGQALSSIASDWGEGEEDNLPADVAGLEHRLGQDETFTCVQGTDGLECAW